MKIIFQVDGGIGKSVAATAVCKAIKIQFPKDELIVVTGYPEVFFCNPNIDRVLNFNEQLYFYRDHIMGQQVKMMLHNPYLETDFVAGNGHLIKVWCEMFGIQYNGEQPELFLTSREQSFYSNQFGSQKPIMLLQTNGGGSNQPNKYSWTRDLPLSAAQQVVYAYANDYNIIHIRREDQPQLQGVTPFQSGFRAIAALIRVSEKRLFIDSFCQHVAAALGKPSVVAWIGNTPAQFGYDMHHNIIANPPTIRPELRHSVYSKYNISGNATEFPYNNEAEIFNVPQIIDAVKNDKEELNNGSKTTNNLRLKEKILADQSKGSMVAHRLSFLADKADLTGIKQVLDIGSWHLGQSIEFSHVFRNARIDAFEPVPDSYQLCLANREKLDEQKKSRINVHNIALNNTEGEVPFYPINTEVSKGFDAGFSSMLKFNDGLQNTENIQKEIKVKANTLDNWCKEHNVSEVDIMWIDVQGAELHVFQGAAEILKNTKIIMTEVGLKPYYEGHTLKADIDEFLIGLGFTELESSFEMNIRDYEANTIYIRN